MPARSQPSLPPCVLHEDEHLLVVNKPAGWNTHAPGPFAGEGIYDWLRHREPRWAKLAIIHRLDKETSGIIVFGKTPLANKSLTEQFAAREVRKKYFLLSTRAPGNSTFVARSKISRAGERYASSPQGEDAETEFTVLSTADSRLPAIAAEVPKSFFVIAEPRTGRTHQIRVHAAENGFLILGDLLYGGTPFGRVCLHSAQISFRHPATNQPVTFNVPPQFTPEPRAGLREGLIEQKATTAFRILHGSSDGQPGLYVERLGNHLLSQSESALTPAQQSELAKLAAKYSAQGAYHKILNRQVRRTTPGETSPRPVLGETAPEKFDVIENGLRFELSFQEGYSVGLFLDQRDNRRRLLTGHVAADFALFDEAAATPRAALEVLNTFAYTCGFSVCAAKAGARVTSLDLSKKYLEWGRRNFRLNGLDPAAHDFIFGDAFDWLRRLARKGRAFDAIVLDPPTFSQSKAHGAFRVEKDLGKLVETALPLLKERGVLLISTNAAEWAPEDFLANVESVIRLAGRKILKRHYAPQPPDFPVSRSEPAYLKTVWLRVE